ncbi:hypothetical protein BU24DRAFT_489875 [Aaosphaeria arxii CBS 175.79]|uniref:mRNA decay factor PAT1 domain-containing protein n=1 Tax=Aaosphaeria arxii CBS 175.79 TaxID=1450172 RepID=A0A6A5Y3B9_9PLEO|nr:uncharacterized protein BU24DRAFT_489875 [Aaosphaeria arxii CBS 175.79]KAF2020032.1 hypothetical protein BU24DRAFT_489875 [Aaosphaeria arxii CBS 175.79]
MSFFGFDTTLPKDRGHSTNAPGFGQTPDAFAGFRGGALDEDDALDFEETYDGLGNQLLETGDDFNDETFGDGPATQQSVGRDFDFAGQTSQIAGTMQEEQMLFEARNQRAPRQQNTFVPPPSKPARTGYENYKDPEYIPQLEARADIWGLAPKTSTKQPENHAPPASARKMLSLEEVEAQLRAQSLGQAAMQPVQSSPSQAPIHMLQHQHQHQLQQQHQQQMSHQMHQQIPFNQGQYPGPPGPFAPQILQRPQQSPQVPQAAVNRAPPPQQQQQQQQQHRVELPAHPAQQQPSQPPTILQRPQQDGRGQQNKQAQQQGPPQGPPSQPRQILQNPNRLAGQGQPISQGSSPNTRGPAHGHNRGPSFSGMVITHPDQLLQLSEQERATFLEEDAKRAKRNHKIALLAKDNGLMTPQDKNFITRIQLQQLMSATGNLEEIGSEAALAEDFYYQVFSQIRGAPRQNPHQPANQFAQTYLFQTNSRFGPGRRHGRGGDNHMQRMEQQVQRAVEAAKTKPKGRQLVIEGSLGKIAFSNARTPRPLLNIKRSEAGDKHAKQHKPSIADRKEVLRNIEAVYITLMHMEDHERALPPPINENSDPEAIQKHMEWRSKIEELHAQLWQNIKIMEPINPSSHVPHPFIAILSHAKGKKAIPRIFRHIDEQERITVVTMIVVHLDNLSVVANAIASPDEPLSSAVREEVELFTHSVMPPLFAHISDSPLNIVIGLLGLILDRTNLHIVSRSKIGMSLLTILISRAELLKQSAPEVNPQEWEQWTNLYNRLFDAVEPVLPLLFPGSVNDTDDMYVWQFLAAMGVGASPDQQQRLVLGVKDRVMETVTVSKALPAEMAGARLSNVNLFMRAIGLDVELLG